MSDTDGRDHYDVLYMYVQSQYCGTHRSSPIAGFNHTSANRMMYLYTIIVEWEA
jgi:hypothetical protein